MSKALIDADVSTFQILGRTMTQRPTLLFANRFTLLQAVISVFKIGLLKFESQGQNFLKSLYGSL